MITSGIVNINLLFECRSFPCEKLSSLLFNLYLTELDVFINSNLKLSFGLFNQDNRFLWTFRYYQGLLKKFSNFT